MEMIFLQKLIMIGTGHGFVFDCYNTCFLMQNDDKYFLIDTGGSAHIVQNLQKLNINLGQIHDIFISHCHTDHILGLFWILKRLAGMIRSGKYEGSLNIYCNDEVANSIRNIYPNLFPNLYVDLITKYLNIVILNDNETKNIAGKDYTFFDVKARENKLYGFETELDDNKKLVFLGDETCNPEIYDKIKNCDYVMHEAFCLDSEQDIFKPYEKHHSTVKSVCENFKDFNIKNLILFHTEDTHLNNRKELYLNEGKQYYSNNILIPDDLEIIELN